MNHKSACFFFFILYLKEKKMTYQMLLIDRCILQKRESKKIPALNMK